MNQSLGYYCCILTVLTATVLAVQKVEERPADALEKPLTSIPSRLGNWQARTDLTLEKRVQELLRSTEYIGRRYERNGQELELFISYYAQQRAGEAMHSPKNCLPGSGWEIWKYDSGTILHDRRNVPVNLLSIQNAGRRMKVIYWYQSRQRVIANEYKAKLLLARDALFDGRTAGSIVRITVPDNSSSVAAALEFAALLMPEVQRVTGH